MRSHRPCLRTCCARALGAQNHRFSSRRFAARDFPRPRPACKSTCASAIRTISWRGLGVQGAGSRSVRLIQQACRKALCRPDLGSVRRQQDRGQGLAPGGEHERAAVAVAGGKCRRSGVFSVRCTTSRLICAAATDAPQSLCRSCIPRKTYRLHWLQLSFDKCLDLFERRYARLWKKGK